MGEVYTYDATHLTLIREGTVELTNMAEHGQVGSGRFAIDDVAGTLSIVGQKDFSHTESSCSVPLTFRGYISDRRYGRDAGTQRQPHVAAGRGIGVELLDVNAMLGFRLIDGTDGIRPAETVADRIAWLLASNYLSGLLIDNGRITSVTGKGMDKANYQYSNFPGDVLADCALAAGGFNYYVADFGSGPELVFRDENASTADTSTLRISNVLADASATTLNPFQDAELSRRPGRVVSKLADSYAKGTVIEERPETATAFNGERGGTASNSNVKTDAQARAQAQTKLWQLHTEEDVIECTVLVTSAQVNLILAGQRIQAKFSHLATEGYGSAFTYFRVLERTVRPIVADAGLYELHLRLSPQEPAPPTAAIVQSAFGRTGSAFGNLTLTLPNPVTIGNTLLVLVAKRDDATPVAPNTLITYARFGAGAWTRLDDSVTNVINVDSGGAGEFDGVAGYYKTADSTSQSGVVGASYALAGIWEIAGADMASATVVAQTGQTTTTDPAVFDIGSLGTGAVGDVAMLLAAWCNNVEGSGARHEYIPLPAVSSGVWTERYYKGAYTFSYGVHPAEAHPDCWFGDTVGTGAALSASISKPKAEPYGSTGTTGWAGLAIRIPPL